MKETSQKSHNGRPCLRRVKGKKKNPTLGCKCCWFAIHFFSHLWAGDLHILRRQKCLEKQGVGFCLASFRVELLSWEINFHLGITASGALMIHIGQKIIHTNMVGAWNFPSIEHADYLLHLIHCPILPFKTRKKKVCLSPPRFTSCNEIQNLLKTFFKSSQIAA